MIIYKSSAPLFHLQHCKFYDNTENGEKRGVGVISVKQKQK